MSQLSEYLQHHFLLAGAAAAMAIVVLAYELRHATRQQAAVSASELVRLVNSGALLLDVRAKSAFDAGHIANARNVPGETIADGAKGLERWKEKAVIAYCDTGTTGGAAARQLARLGFKQVYSLRGGLAGWRGENLPVTRS
jgi:rhodanese-related sulfurtransferase